MNKINYKYFKKITSEPIEVQETEKGVVEIHSLNESIFYDEYISKGKFQDFIPDEPEEYIAQFGIKSYSELKSEIINNSTFNYIYIR